MAIFSYVIIGKSTIHFVHNFPRRFPHDFGVTEGAPQDICHAIRALRRQLLALWQVLDGPWAARKSIGKSWGKLEKPGKNYGKIMGIWELPQEF